MIQKISSSIIVCNFYKIFVFYMLIILGCSPKVDQKLVNKLADNKISTSTQFEKYIQHVDASIDTIKSYENTKFHLQLKNKSNKDVQLIRTSSIGNIHFELQPNALPLTIPAGSETYIPVKMLMGSGIGWYEGTARFTFSDNTIETLSRTIYADWPAHDYEIGITKYFKDPFPMEIKKDRFFIEKREIKADVKFVAHYFVHLYYDNNTNDTIYISKIDFNKNVISWSEQPPQFIPPNTSSALGAMIELGSSNEFNETVTIYFRDYPTEKIHIKLLVNYLEDYILIKQDSLCTTPLFGGKQNAYQSEIAFNKFVRDHIFTDIFEKLGIYGSGNTFIFNFMVNESGQIVDITCKPNKFPEIESLLKEILAKSPIWKPSKCAQGRKQNKTEKTISVKYKYNIDFPEPMQPTSKW